MMEAGTSTDLPDGNTTDWQERYSQLETMLLGSFHFDNFQAFNYEYPLSDDEDKIAFSLADKRITVDGEEVLLITLVNRSGAYGAEWVSNFNVGTGGEHLGFSRASQGETAILNEYYGDVIADPNVKVKIVVTGYSRGAATANLTGHRVNELFRQNGRSTDDVYVYTFATPNSVQGTENGLRNGNENIFNILSQDDFVTAVPLGEWNFHHYGVDLYLPGYSDTQSAAQMYRTLQNQVLTGGFEKYPMDIQVWAEQSYANAYFSQLLYDTFGGLSYFNTHYQSSVTNLCELIFRGNGQENAAARFKAVGLYALTKAVCSLNTMEPFTLEKVNWILGSAGTEATDLMEDETDIETVAGELARQLIAMSADKRDLICELLTGMDIETLTEYLIGKLALWEMKSGTLTEGHWLLSLIESYSFKKLTDAFGSEEALEAALEAAFSPAFGTHIACTHRHEHYLAWLLAFDGKELFKDRVDVTSDDDLITGSDIEGEIYEPSTASRAKNVPTYVKTDNGVQMLYNPSSADMCYDLMRASYQIGKSNAAFMLVMQNYGYTQTHYIEDSGVYTYATRNYTETAYGEDGNIFEISKKEDLNFSAANALVGIRRVEYNGKVKYAVAVAFRGSQDLADWVTDARFLPNVENGFHSGFLANINDLYADMMHDIYFKIDGQTVSFASIVEDMKREDSRYCMMVTGHSLGAAMADLLVGYKLKNAGVYAGNVVAYTFAAPKTVPSSYDYPDSNIFNIINTDDLVPKVGAEKHIGTDINYTPDDVFRERYGSDILSAHSSATTYRVIEDAVSANPENWLNATTSIIRNVSFTVDQSTYGSFSSIENSGTVTNNGVLTVSGDLKNEGILINNGTVQVSGDVANHQFVGGAQLYNNGTLRIAGSLDCYSYSVNWHFGDVIQDDPAAILTVGGDMNFYSESYSGITAGEVILNGNDGQTVSNLAAPTVILENASDEGVVFSTAITVTRLFDHRGNVFTLKQGGNFADYDGDGLADNVDPTPTGVLPGDLDGDGSVANADITLLIRCLSGWADVKIDMNAADLDRNGILNNRDAITLIRVAAGRKENAL